VKEVFVTHLDFLVILLGQDPCFILTTCKGDEKPYSRELGGIKIDG
jgi:hypothetical protein